MAESEQIKQIEPEELRNLLDLRDTREEVLRELGREEGRREARQEFAKKMLELGRPLEEVAEITELTAEEIQKLRS